MTQKIITIFCLTIELKSSEYMFNKLIGAIKI